ncbi:MAG: 2-dehydro-3-deoxyphosphooctonate aldolase [Caldithrix sp.]|nr:2-dehydro-3-deoxyphosphooctonate aldolase [Caldithrix sp.]
MLIYILPYFLQGQDLPSSERSRQAINRVRPSLQRALAEQNLQWGAPVFMRIFKQEMQLEIWLKQDSRFQHFKTYTICTYGRQGLGPKLRQGDGKAPEGFYYVTPNRLNPLSRFHLSFNLGYPNSYDRLHGRTGGALMVHGSCVSIGCYAMTDAGIEEIYATADAALRNGQPFFRVHIFPFRLTNAHLTNHQDSTWLDFWINLKQGYDFFENNGHLPPDVQVRDSTYIFDHP